MHSVSLMENQTFNLDKYCSRLDEVKFVATRQSSITTSPESRFIADRGEIRTVFLGNSSTRITFHLNITIYFDPYRILLMGSVKKSLRTRPRLERSEFLAGCNHENTSKMAKCNETK